MSNQAGKGDSPRNLSGEYRANYGKIKWNRDAFTCGTCDSKDVYLIERPEHYDGWCEIMCNKCNNRTGRWSGKVLGDGEIEDVRLRFNSDAPKQLTFIRDAGEKTFNK